MRISSLVLAAMIAGGCGGGEATVDAGGVDAGVTASDGGAPPPRDAATSSATEAIIRMCLMNNACGYQTRFFREADRCVEQALSRIAERAEAVTPEHALHFARMVECARTAATCADYTRCADFGVACSGVVQPRCDGTVRNACSTPGGNFQPRTFDCAAWSGGSCAGGACVYPSAGATCASPGAARCDGDTRVYCRQGATGAGGVELRAACPAGTRCVGPSAFGTGDVSCYPLGTCAAEALRCDGDTLVYCGSMGGSLVELRSDCAAVGRRCGANARGQSACVPAATECAAATSGTSGTCEGGAIRVCIEGRVRRIDCASVGLGACAVTAGVPGCR